MEEGDNTEEPELQYDDEDDHQPQHQLGQNNGPFVNQLQQHRAGGFNAVVGGPPYRRITPPKRQAAQQAINRIWADSSQGRK